MKTSNILFFCVFIILYLSFSHYYYFYLPCSTSTSLVLPLPRPVLPHLPHSCPHPRACMLFAQIFFFKFIYHHSGRVITISLGCITKPGLHIVVMVVSTVFNMFLTLFQAVLIHMNAFKPGLHIVVRVAEHACDDASKRILIFKALSISITIISCEKSIFTIITARWRRNHSWTA